MGHRISYYKKGFTLIELLVVIAVIGILAAVILASLNGARNKGKDAAVREAMKQFQILLALEYDTTGSYANLQPGVAWMPGSTCSSQFTTGSNAAKAVEICNNIVSNASSWFAAGKFYAGNGISNSQSYSIIAALGTNKLLCIGSSGQSEVDTGTYTNPGCYFNP